jgi:pentatricopeptide repeat protein
MFGARVVPRLFSVPVRRISISSISRFASGPLFRNAALGSRWATGSLTGVARAASGVMQVRTMKSHVDQPGQMIAELLRNKEEEKALSLFDLALEKRANSIGVTTYNVVMGYFAEKGDVARVQSYFDKMLESSISPNERSVAALVTVHCMARDTAAAIEAIKRLSEFNLLDYDVVYHALAIGLVETGFPSDAFEVITQVKRPMEELFIQFAASQGSTSDTLQQLYAYVIEERIINSPILNAIASRFIELGDLENAHKAILDGAYDTLRCREDVYMRYLALVNEQRDYVKIAEFARFPGFGTNLTEIANEMIERDFVHERNSYVKETVDWEIDNHMPNSKFTDEHIVELINRGYIERAVMMLEHAFGPRSSNVTKSFLNFYTLRGDVEGFQAIMHKVRSRKLQADSLTLLQIAHLAIQIGDMPVAINCVVDIARKDPARLTPTLVQFLSVYCATNHLPATGAFLEEKVKQFEVFKYPPPIGATRERVSN